MAKRLKLVTSESFRNIFADGKKRSVYGMRQYFMDTDLNHNRIGPVLRGMFKNGELKRSKAPHDLKDRTQKVFFYSKDKRYNPNKIKGKAVAKKKKT